MPLLGSGHTRCGRLAVEDRPADLVTQPLVIQYEIANLLRQSLTLPATLLPTSALALAFRSSGPCRLDRVRSCTELVGCHVGDRRRLASGVCRPPRRTGQLSGCGVGVACCRARLGHRYLATYPRPSLLHRTARPRIRGLGRLEKRQDVFSAFSRPLSEESMMGVFQRAPATDGDESGIAHLGEDHSSAHLTSSAQRYALLAAGWAWTMFGSRRNSKPEKCLKTATNPRRPVHVLLGSSISNSQCGHYFLMLALRRTSIPDGNPMTKACSMINSMSWNGVGAGRLGAALRGSTIKFITMKTPIPYRSEPTMT